MGHTYSECQKCKSVNKVNMEKALAQQAICGKCSAELRFHGLVSEVDAAAFWKIVRVSDRPVIVDFWASWCGPCKMYGPEYEAASRDYKNAVFLKVNTEVEQALSGQLGIRGIPCTIIYKGGSEVKRQSGAMSSQQVKELLNSVS